jgi:hypothetical protein
MRPGKPKDKTLAKRRRASQRLSSEADSELMTPGKPQDTTLAKRRRLKTPSVANMSLGSHKTRRWQTDAERCYAYRLDADSRFHFCKHEPREATRHDAGKPTPSDVTPLVATPTLDTKAAKASGSDIAQCWQNDTQRRDTNRRDAAKRRHI